MSVRSRPTARLKLPPPPPLNAAIDDDDDKNDSDDDSNHSDNGGGGWNTATATWYISYPPCCNPGFKGDKSECDDYSGCKYQGLFAAFDEKKSESWVRDNNIVAFYQSPNSQNRKEWGAKWKNRRLRLRNPKTGKIMEVTIVDTCDNKDCLKTNCCSTNADKNGGTLIDLERPTALRFDDGKVADLTKIEWEIV